MKLSAEPPVGAGIILVRQTPDGAFAWATGSTVMRRPVLGSADNEAVAHLAALEVFLDHPDHVGHRLTLDVKDNPAGHVIVDFVAEHLPHIPVTARRDLRADGGRMFGDIWDALEALVTPRPEPVRIVAATHGSRRPKQPEGGWAWVTTDGRWETGDIRGRKTLAVEVLALLRLVLAHPDADSIHIGCDSKQAIAVIHHLRTGEAGINAAMKDLNLKHPKYLTMMETLINHPAEITFQWVPVDEGYLLSDTAHRLAVQACLALQSGMDKSTFTRLQADIVADFRERLPKPGGKGDPP